MFSYSISTYTHHSSAISSETSVTSSINSHLPPLARLRKQRLPVFNPSIKEEDEDEENNHDVVLGSSITISNISDTSNVVSSDADVANPLKDENKFGNMNSPTSVVEDMFDDTKHTDYRNAMDRIRKLMTATPENDGKQEDAKVIGKVQHHDNNDTSLDKSSVFADLASTDHDASQEFNNKNEDEESIIQSIRLPGPIDVDTCKRHITPMERRNLRAMHKLGYHYLRQNEINTALDVFMEIFRGQRERHGKKSLEAAMAMHNLGVVCVECGRFEEGVKLCDGAARIRVEQLGADHLDVAVSI